MSRGWLATCAAATAIFGALVYFAVKPAVVSAPPKIVHVPVAAHWDGTPEDLARIVGAQRIAQVACPRSLPRSVSCYLLLGRTVLIQLAEVERGLSA